MSNENPNSHNNKAAGYKLTRNIYDHSGTLLIRKGTVLTESMITLLHNRNVKYEDWVDGPLTDK
ncbi:MAG: hypothetical protein PHF24_04185 [Syntrophomonas sp.]|nr:hypothetical protein [Syntrophomonas sp.]